MEYRRLKQCLSHVGVFISPKTIHLANGLINYLNVGRWFHEQHLKIPLRFPDRQPLYDCIATLVKEPTSYLEFGVFKGASLRHWSSLLKHPETVLHGFDSFEGLPENWRHLDKTIFAVGEGMPKFEDPRVKLFKGWFSDTLPGYLRDFKPHPNLVLHMDADLYSSTTFVLAQMRPFLRPGSILIFDEFFDREHELKAFTEFLNEHQVKVECLAATAALTQAAFRITAIATPAANRAK